MGKAHTEPHRRSATPPPSANDELAHRRLESRLRAAFEAEPLEDLMDHSAEGILAAALETERAGEVQAWLLRLVEAGARPVLVASVLRCTGRLEDPGTPTWREAMLRTSIASDDFEIRDAAVHVAEEWAIESAIEILRSHSEPELWLREYIQDVIEDLGG